MPKALLKGWQDLIAFQVWRTKQLFEEGRPLPEQVVPELRRRARMPWLLGMTILARTESVCYDALRLRPALSKLDFIRLYFRARRPRGAAQWTAERTRT